MNFTTRRYANAIHAGTVPKWPNANKPHNSPGTLVF